VTTDLWTTCPNYTPDSKDEETACMLFYVLDEETLTNHLKE